jgi:two-component system cell cycle response regulator
MGHARVLLLDENDPTAARIQETLNPVAESVRRAKNCAQAQALLDPSIELVIASLSAPDSDPLRLVSQWRAAEATRQLPIVLMADPGELPRLAKGLDLGANDYIIRPIDRNELMARVRTQIRRKRLQDRLHENYSRSLSLALTDELTGLYNRRYVFAHLTELMARLPDGNATTAVMMFDIDHFKQVNDRYGHPAGDDVLRELAKRALHNVRSVDLVGRLGGEEFVVVMPETNLGGATIVADRLRLAVADDPFVVGNGEKLPVTISVGLAVTGDPEDTLEALLKRVDDALYAAKNGGRNRVVSAPHRTAAARGTPVAVAS